MTRCGTKRRRWDCENRLPTWAFNDLTLTEALGTIARMGFRYVDIGGSTPQHAARSPANHARKPPKSAPTWKRSTSM
ncbi:MAG: hypothetical protein U0694_02220 [Anaerolineae bacterium]